MTVSSLEPNDFLKVLEKIKELLALDPKLKQVVKLYINKENADEAEIKTETTKLPVQSEGVVLDLGEAECNSGSEGNSGEPT